MYSVVFDSLSEYRAPALDPRTSSARDVTVLFLPLAQTCFLQCSWPSDTHLRIDLPSSATIGVYDDKKSGDTGLLPPFKRGAIGSAHVALDVPAPALRFENVATQFGPIPATAVQPPYVFPPAVHAVLQSAALVGCGTDLVLDASQSSGSAGRDFGVVWDDGKRSFLYAPPDEDYAHQYELEAFFAAASAANAAVVTLPSAMLRAGKTYTFGVELTNWMDTESFQGSHVTSVVVVVDAPVPLVTIAGPPLVTQQPDRSLTLAANAAQPVSCNGDDSVRAVAPVVVLLNEFAGHRAQTRRCARTRTAALHALTAHLTALRSCCPFLLFAFVLLFAPARRVVDWLCVERSVLRRRRVPSLARRDA
jgi:hypothetical protein